MGKKVFSGDPEECFARGRLSWAANSLDSLSHSIALMHYDLLYFAFSEATKTVAFISSIFNFTWANIFSRRRNAWIAFHFFLWNWNALILSLRALISHPTFTRSALSLLDDGLLKPGDRRLVDVSCQGSDAEERHRSRETHSNASSWPFIH